MQLPTSIFGVWVASTHGHLSGTIQNGSWTVQQPQWQTVPIEACILHFALLGQAWASPTLAGLHCGSVCVCLFACGHTINFKWARLSFNITKMELTHSVAGKGYCQSAVSVTWSGDDCTEARMATYSLPLQIINSRLPTGSTNFNHDGHSGWLRSLQVRAMHM